MCGKKKIDMTKLIFYRKCGNNFPTLNSTHASDERFFCVPISIVFRYAIHSTSTNQTKNADE